MEAVFHFEETVESLHPRQIGTQDGGFLGCKGRTARGHFELFTHIGTFGADLGQFILQDRNLETPALKIGLMPRVLTSESCKLAAKRLDFNPHFLLGIAMRVSSENQDSLFRLLELGFLITCDLFEALIGCK